MELPTTFGCYLENLEIYYAIENPDLRGGFCHFGRRRNAGPIK